jgi:hypothetical protein
MLTLLRCIETGFPVSTSNAVPSPAAMSSFERKLLARALVEKGSLNALPSTVQRTL